MTKLRQIWSHWDQLRHWPVKGTKLLKLKTVLTVCNFTTKELRRTCPKRSTKVNRQKTWIILFPTFGRDLTNKNGDFFVMLEKSFDQEKFPSCRCCIRRSSEIQMNILNGHLKHQVTLLPPLCVPRPPLFQKIFITKD